MNSFISDARSTVCGKIAVRAGYFGKHHKFRAVKNSNRFGFEAEPPSRNVRAMTSRR